MLGTLNPGNLEPQNPGNPERWNLVTLEICNLAILETCNCGILEPCKALEPCLITLQPWNPGTCFWVAKLGWCNDILKHSSSTGISSLWTRWKWCGVVANFAPPNSEGLEPFHIYPHFNGRKLGYIPRFWVSSLCWTWLTAVGFRWSLHNWDVPPVSKIQVVSGIQTWQVKILIYGCFSH